MIDSITFNTAESKIVVTDDGQTTEYTTPESYLLAYPDRPEDVDAVFNRPQPALADVKAAKLMQIEQDRDAAIAATVTVHDRPWQASKIDVDNLSQELLTVQAGVPMSPIWRDADNSDMVLTDVAQLVVIAAAMKMQKLLAYQTSWTRKAAVNAATTNADVDAA